MDSIPRVLKSRSLTHHEAAGTLLTWSFSLNGPGRVESICCTLLSKLHITLQLYFGCAKRWDAWLLDKWHHLDFQCFWRRDEKSEPSKALLATVGHTYFIKPSVLSPARTPQLS